MMDRPYIICHMLSSIDGKVTGSFLFEKECAAATEIYYKINRERKADGFICGRVTMEESFTGSWYPDLSKYQPVQVGPGEKKDFIPQDLGSFFAIAFDTHGKLGWKSNRIIDPDGDPGYDGARIIEVLSEDVDARYLSYLEEMKIPYLFSGEKSIDINLALKKLKNIVGCNTLLLEGGSVINGAFERSEAVDEISLVIAPMIAGLESKPLFWDSEKTKFSLCKAESENGVLILNYRKE